MCHVVGNHSVLKSRMAFIAQQGHRDGSLRVGVCGATAAALRLCPCDTALVTFALGCATHTARLKCAPGNPCSLKPFPPQVSCFAKGIHYLVVSPPGQDKDAGDS